MATTSTKTPETTKAEATPLQQIIEASYRHIDGFISHRWGEYGTVGQGLRLTPQARMRLGHVFGWLTGLAATGNAEFTKFAEKAATNLFEKLDWLAHYGGYINEENRVPKYLVELHDDGTLHGFSLLWLIAVAPEQQSGSTRRSSAVSTTGTSLRSTGTFTRSTAAFSITAPAPARRSASTWATACGGFTPEEKPC
jgi:hypothetical protein